MTRFQKHNPATWEAAHVDTGLAKAHSKQEEDETRGKLGQA